PDGEDAALPGALASRLHPAPMHPNQRLDQRESQTEAALGAIQRTVPLHEQIEDLGDQVWRNPDSRVLDLQDRTLPVGEYANLDAPLGRRVLEGIADEV